jgi:hypothetical protein
VDVARKWGAEAVDEELDRLISKRASQDRRPHPDEEHEGWRASVRRYNAARLEENRTAWREHHQRQAACLRATLEGLIAHHEAQAARLCELVEDVQGGG